MFTSCLADVPERLGARIHGYAIMPNHYHLMVEVPLGNVSRVMQHVNGTFTRRYHEASGLDGPLFRGRFRSKLVTHDAYWQHLLAYVHLNPVRAHLARRPEECVWTSHAAYVGQATAPSWLTTSELLAAFGSRDALAAYVREVRSKRRPAPEGFDAATLWSRPSQALDEVDEVPVLPPTVALEQVAVVTGHPDPLSPPSGGGAQPVRWMVAWWLHRGAFLPLADVGRRLGISGQRAGVLVRACRRRARVDPELANWMHTLEAQRRTHARRER
jgi:REP element-mobilizing transposase RayT